MHLHDAATDDCISCALHAADASADCAGALHVCDAGSSGGERLVRAVSEFRHRVRLVRRLTVVDASRESGRRVSIMLRELPASVCRRLETLTIEGCPSDALTSLNKPSATAGVEDGRAARSASALPLPPVIVAEQARPRVSIGHAMDVVGSLVKQLVSYDASCSSDDARLADGSASRGHIQHLVLVAASRASAETLQKAVCSIAFKSHLAMPPVASSASQQTQEGIVAVV